MDLPYLKGGIVEATPMTTLPKGRAFEMQVFGITEEVEKFPRYPSKRKFGSGLRQIIDYNWAMYAEALEKGLEYCHNPSKPEMGETGLIWEAVNRHLPRRVKGSSRKALHLYIAIGRNALDWTYGVDAFFWWEGVSVTIDASRIRKPSIKADFLLHPSDLEPQALDLLGSKIASMLKSRRTLYGTRGTKRNLKRKKYAYQQELEFE